MQRRGKHVAMVALFLSSRILSAQPAGAVPCTVAQAGPCSVVGKLTLRHVYGPPWFGEKKGDKPRFIIYVIQLPAPIHIACIRDQESDPVKDCGITTRIQIYPRDANLPESKLRSLVGSEVIATGVTSEPIAPMDQTPGIMDISSLKPLTKTAAHQ